MAKEPTPPPSKTPNTVTKGISPKPPRGKKTGPTPTPTPKEITSQDGPRNLSIHQGTKGEAPGK